MISDNISSELRNNIINDEDGEIQPVMSTRLRAEMVDGPSYAGELRCIADMLETDQCGNLKHSLQWLLEVTHELKSLYKRPPKSRDF